MEETAALSNRQWKERRAQGPVPFCWFPPRQTSTSHNLYPHPDTSHRLNPKLPCAKHDNPASPPTSTPKLLPQNKTKTDNYHLCCLRNTIINRVSANYIVYVWMDAQKNANESAYVCGILHRWKLLFSFIRCVVKGIKEEICLENTHFPFYKPHFLTPAAVCLRVAVQGPWG